MDGIFKKLRSRGKLHPKQVDNALADMRTALLDADVSVEVADELLARVRKRALSEEVMKSLTPARSEEHTSELQSRENLVCRLLLEKKKIIIEDTSTLNEI